jgi:hypothetical protein
MKTRLLASLAALSCCTFSGCSHPHPAVHVYIGLDASGSARRDRGRYAVLTKGLTEQLQAGQDRLTLYRVDRETHEFSDGVYDGNVEVTLKTLAVEVKAPARQSGTLPAKFWQQAAEHVRQDHGPVVICLMSDGDNDDMRAASWQQMHVDALRLAQCRQVRAVVVCGARAENWERLRAALAPLGSRLHLLSPTQLDAETLPPYLERARQ